LIPRPERRFARPAHPNQGDAHPAHLLFVAKVAHQPKDHILEAVLRQALEKSLDQSLFRRLVGLRQKQAGHGHLERPGDPLEQHDRDVSFAGLQLREVAFGNVGLL